MKNATPTETANYIKNTGCRFLVTFTDGRQREKSGFLEAYLKDGLTVDIWTDIYGLPSHLTPHNPAGLSAEQITEGGKYRAVTSEDSTDQDHQFWVNTRWMETSKCEGTFASLTNRAYRLPADIPPPDWEEMSKASPQVEIIKEATVEYPYPTIGIKMEESQMHKDVISHLRKLDEFEARSAKAVVKESSTPQPAPGETLTPETEAAWFSVGRSQMHVVMRDFARTLERQRDQAREELAALQEQCQREGRAGAEAMRIEQLQSEVQALREQRDEANADRVRLREALGLIRDTNETAEVLSPSMTMCVTEQLAIDALESTPPPEMVSKAQYKADMELMSGRYEAHVQRMLEMPSAKSFRAGWEAAFALNESDVANLEEALREHMAENEPKGVTLAEVEGGEG